MTEKMKERRPVIQVKRRTGGQKEERKRKKETMSV